MIRTLFLSVFVLMISASCYGVTITSMEQNKDEVGQYEKFELTFILSENYNNPFDPDEVDIMAEIIQPDSASVNVPAFYYKDYDIEYMPDEKYVNGNSPCWKVRFAPTQLGIYKYTVLITDLKDSYRFEGEKTFKCIPGDRHGFIRRNEEDYRFLKHDDGTSFIPIGHNVAWNVEESISSWKEIFESMGNAKENLVRIWMTSYYTGPIIEWTSQGFTGEYYDGVGKFSLPISWKLDRILEAIEENDLYVQIVLQQHGQFSSQVDSSWFENPYNITSKKDNGFLDKPEEFFYNEKAKKLTRNKYRYIAARWGYSQNIFAWELFNEVQFTDSFRSSTEQQKYVIQWHSEMADFLKGIDINKHLVTTSSDTDEVAPVWNLKNIDLIQHHFYGNNTIDLISDSVKRLSHYKKPVYIAEFGLDGVGEAEAEPDKQGSPLLAKHIREALHLHNGIWSSSLIGSCAMIWYWDNYIAPGDHYREFTALSNYWKGENPENLQKANVSFQGGPGQKGLYLVPGLMDFFAKSRDTKFKIVPDEDTPSLGEVSVWLQGEWHNDYRTDPVFEIEANIDGEFIVHVADVASGTYNSMDIFVDDQKAESKVIKGEDKSFTMFVPVSKGIHTVQVKNTGKDWYKIQEYEFTCFEQNAAKCIGLSGSDKAYLWIYDLGSQYGKVNNGLFSGLKATLFGINDGIYIIDFYKTRGDGGLIHSLKAESSQDKLEFTVPDFEKDIAVKIYPDK